MKEKCELYNENSLDVFYKIINQYHDENIILVSDPPFNINYKYNTYLDNMDEDEYYEMLDFFFRDLPSVVIHYPEQLYKLSFQIGKFPERVVSWVYNSNTAKQHRDIAFFDVKPDMNKVRQPYKNPNDKRIKERIARGCKGAKLYDWWEINQVKNVSKEKTNHPCQMPLEVMKRIIGILPDDCLIVDPFMGSGTTGVAVIEMNKEQNANRKFIGIEFDKKYFDIAEQRIIDVSGV
jgi:DNA modification methylase